MENQFKGTLGKLTYKKLFEEPIYCEANDSYQNSYDVFNESGKQITSVNYQSNKDLGIGINNQNEAEAYALLISKAPEMLEMLEDILKCLDKGDVYHSYKIQELINSATKL